MHDVAVATLDCLTRREADALLWIARGKTSWEAGQILGITEATMNAHVANACEKLAAANRAHLVAQAFLRGILAAGAARVMWAMLALLCASADIDAIKTQKRGHRGWRRDVAALVVHSGGIT